MNFPYASRPVDDGFDNRGAGRGIPVLMGFSRGGVATRIGCRRGLTLQMIRRNTFVTRTL